MRRMFSVKQIKKIAQDATDASFQEVNEAIGELDEEKQDKLGATSKVVVKTLDVKQALSEIPITMGDAGGRTITPRFCKGVVSGGIMYVVMSLYVENNTEETIAAGNINFDMNNIPSEVANKIICFNGASVGDETLGNPQICGITLKYNATLGDTSNRYLFKVAQNSIRIPVNCPSLASGANTQIEGRVFILLL